MDPFEMMNQEEAEHIVGLVNKILVVIEEKDCTYREVIRAIDAIKRHYENNGRDLLNDKSIKEVACYNAITEKPDYEFSDSDFCFPENPDPATADKILLAFEQDKETGNVITVKTEDFEKSGTLLNVICGCINYKKKFRITIEYDPELPNAKIRYEEIIGE